MARIVLNVDRDPAAAIEICRQIKAIDCPTPMTVVAATIEPTTQPRLMAMGFDAVISQPLIGDALFHAIENATSPAPYR